MTEGEIGKENGGGVIKNIYISYSIVLLFLLKNDCI